MEASELRIGNWVIDADDNNRVIQIEDGDDIDFAKDYTSIPLTEEWLVKFGFQKLAGYDYPIKAIGTNWVAELSIANKCILLHSPNAMRNIPLVFNMEYVHSLQNWWLANAGEELQIKDHD